MKILFLVSNLSKNGGIQIYNRNLIDAVSKSEQDVCVVEFFGSNILDKILFTLRIFLKVIYCRPDIIWCGHINFSVIGYWTKKLLGINYFVSVYGIDAWNIKPRFKKYLLSSRMILSVSRFTAAKVITQVPVLNDRIQILHPAVFREESLRVGEKPEYLINRYGINGKKVILTISRLSLQERYKGYDKIIDSMADILKIEPRAVYILAGGGDDLSRLRLKISTMNLDGKVIVTGEVPDPELPDLYNLADIFVLPSNQEGFGIVLVEALASGKRVIAESAAGAIEALDKGNLGKLISFDNPQEFVKEIVKGLKKTDSLKTREDIRSSVLKKFGEEVFLSGIKDILDIFSDHIVVCYFGRYVDSYPRVKVFINGLRENGINVVECRSIQKNRLLRLLDLTIKYFKVFRQIDVLLVCEAGQAYTPLAKLLALITRKPLAIDAFVSHYHVKTVEGHVSQKSLKGKYYYYLDKVACMLTDLVFLDTWKHVDYFVDTFGLNRHKFQAVIVGSDDNIFYPRKYEKKDNILRIFMVASFYPLHGIEYVIRSGKLLEKHKDVEFYIYGDGQLYPEMKNLISDLNVTNVHLMGRIEIEKLPDVMKQMDICLGQFGGTQQAQIVIPIKVFDALAMGKVVITGRTAVAESVFDDGSNIIMCASKDPKDLSKKILELKGNKELRNRIEKNARDYFVNNASSYKIGQSIKGIIVDFIQNN